MIRVRVGLFLVAVGGVVLGIVLAGNFQLGSIGATLEKALAPGLMVVGLWLILIGRRGNRAS